MSSHPENVPRDFRTTGFGDLSDSKTKGLHSKDHFSGYVKTPLDALRLMYAAKSGKIPCVTRNLDARNPKELALIRNGAVFILYIKSEGHPKWIDPVYTWRYEKWVGPFRTYIQGANAHVGPFSDCQSATLEKKVMTAKIGDSHYRLISYYEPQSIDKLERPLNIYQDLPDFRDVTVSGKSVYPSVDNADGVATSKIGPEDMIKEEIPAEPHLTTLNTYSIQAFDASSRTQSGRHFNPGLPPQYASQEVIGPIQGYGHDYSGYVGSYNSAGVTPGYSPNARHLPSNYPRLPDQNHTSAPNSSSVSLGFPHYDQTQSDYSSTNYSSFQSSTSRENNNGQHMMTVGFPRPVSSTTVDQLTSYTAIRHQPPSLPNQAGYTGSSSLGNWDGSEAQRAGSGPGMDLSRPSLSVPHQTSTSGRSGLPTSNFSELRNWDGRYANGTPPQHHP